MNFLDVLIERDIPIPQERSFHRYPWDRLEVGQSFLYKSKASSAQSAAHREGKKLGKRFLTRKVEGGVRIWRIE